MTEDNKIVNSIKYIFGILVVIATLYIISNIIAAVEIMVGIITLSVGVLSIMWTLIARYSLSPKSKLRVFTNNFLACSIAVIAFSLIRLLERFINLPWLILVEFFFVFATFFFFLLASYYMYSIGREFGFEREAKNIKDILRSKKFTKKIKR